VILQYTRVDIESIVKYTNIPPSLIDPKILSASKLTRKIVPLDGEEIERLRGTLLALDSEFVEIQKEETEVKSNGSKCIVRPAKLALARISIVRGEGPQSGVPFIDDYIEIEEPVIDYLTLYSGIEPSDLDPEKSLHSLGPLKVHNFKRF
jgi:PAB-dependent poly(A)-specific ribonuclease subunit 2